MVMCRNIYMSDWISFFQFEVVFTLWFEPFTVEMLSGVVQKKLGLKKIYLVFGDDYIISIHLSFHK